MKRSWVGLPGCAVSLAAAVAVFALAVYVLASCATFGDTTRQLDADGVRKTVREWTGASLPESITVETAQQYLSRDSSMKAVLDAPSIGVEGFLEQLGERRLSFYAPDCADLARPVAFATSGPTRTVGSPPSSGSRISGFSGGMTSLIGAVESGELERCLSVVSVFANPTGAFVEAAIQAKPDGMSRVILHVYYT